MERMTCVYEEKDYSGVIVTRILMDNLTGIQYLVVKGHGNDSGIAIIPMLDREGQTRPIPFGGQPRV